MEDNKLQKTKITLTLTDMDVQTTLVALGGLQTRAWDKGENTKSIEIVIDKIYRAMGARLD